MIKTQNLSKSYNGNLAVDRLTLDINAGEVFGFLGPNGAGKTTTIRMLCGLIGPSEGQAWVAGFRIGEDDHEIRKKAGILTEAQGFYDRLSAQRNLEFFAELYGVEDVDGQVERYLRLLGLWDRRTESAGTFSKGMRQKLAIARALLHEPEILFLDEPTTGLDPSAARLVRDFIEELKREGRTIFMSTHNLSEADRLCDRVAVIKTRVLALDQPAELRQKLFGRTVVFHLSQFEDRFLSAFEGLDFIQGVDRYEQKIVVTLDQPEEHNPLLIQRLVEQGAEIQFVGEMKRTLEDVYLRLLGDEHQETSAGEARSS
jgi:ABC-2 type transport system ATP-binding protein